MALSISSIGAIVITDMAGTDITITAMVGTVDIGITIATDGVRQLAD